MDFVSNTMDCALLLDESFAVPFSYQGVNIMDDELLELIRELADELENEIRDRYSDGNYSIHHAY